MTSLPDLYHQHDEAWNEYVAIPYEHRELGKEPQPDAKAAGEKLDALTRQIEGHPDHRDFETDLREALGDEIRAATKAPGWYEDNGNNKAIAVYRALGNVDWEHERGSRYSCSFRYAGTLIARIRGEGDYLDWYCSGLEGTVDDDIAEALAAKGWKYKELR